jgi:hypothetical protein
MRKLRTIFLYTALGIVLLAAAAWARRHALEVPAPPAGRPAIPSLQTWNNRAVLSVPERHLIAEVAEYEDELFAHLITSYLRGTATFQHWEMLLTVREVSGHLVYPVIAHYRGPDVPEGLYTLYTAEARGLIPIAKWRLAQPAVLEQFRRQNRVFEAAYQFPVRRPMERLTRPELIRYASRFIRFKSTADPRTWRRGAASLQPLTSSQARELSQDIVTVAEFYSLPLDFFMGIAAMENNYMDARGDSAHAVWKSRAQRGDIVLKRRGSQVLISNYSVGIWQITRETLRYAHRLYEHDGRDYERLPAGLRPAPALDLDAVDARVLTVYAGLLFRDLLDRCGGDVDCAVGAYNGGLRNPNYLYARGVSAAAEHARDFMEHAAVLGAPVARMQFMAGS